MGSVDIGMSTLGSGVGVVRITGAPPIVLHAARRYDDHRKGVKAIFAALRAVRPRRLE
jgi:hypothetical protein